MGTRCIVDFIDDGGIICRLYRQYDGYPEGMGVDLARAVDRKLTNGITYAGDGKPKLSAYTTANGMRELAVLAILALKDQPGNVYLEPPNGPPCEWAEYLYAVRGKEGEKPTISCYTQASNGNWPFNMQQDSHCVFEGLTPDQVIMRFEEETAAK